MKKRVLVLAHVFVMITGLCLFAFSPCPQIQELSASNTSLYLGKGRWHWTIFIHGPDEVLENVRYVEYTLHPTFPEPVQEVNDRGEGPHAFAFSAVGWGVFEVSIKVIFRNRRILRMKHMLTFESPPVIEPLPIRVDNEAHALSRGRWEWTVYLQGEDEVLDKIQCVEYTLHPTFPEPVQEVCERSEGPHAFPLSAIGWGVFEIKVRVFLKDGRVQHMMHNLKF